MVTTKTSKKPGRPKIVKSNNTALETTENDTVQEAVRNEAQREVKKSPRKRIPFGAPRTKLEVPFKPEGYHLHWVNDDAGRIFAAQQGGYSFVTPDEVGMENSEESKVKALVGKNTQNGPLFAYLMKIEQEYYDEDRESINQRQNSFEQALKQQGNNQNGEHGYVPKEGIKLT